jgi:hypothetical protein
LTENVEEEEEDDEDEDDPSSSSDCEISTGLHSTGLHLGKELGGGIKTILSTSLDSEAGLKSSLHSMIS